MNGNGKMFGTLLASRPKHDVAGTAGMTLGSIIFHGILIGLLAWATVSAGTTSAANDDFRLIEIEQEEPPVLPPPPPPMDKIDVAPVDVAQGFQVLTIPTIIPTDIPPPVPGVSIRAIDYSGEGVENGRGGGTPGAPPVRDLELAPIYTVMTLKPELINRDDVARALVRQYPPLLRDAGIGGKVLLWFFINEQGAVVKTQLKETSGYAQLDEAAAKVATIMRFSPAQNHDKKVPVWIEIPILFQINR
jgi:periplasmic protein TonB